MFWVQPAHFWHLSHFFVLSVRRDEQLVRRSAYFKQHHLAISITRAPTCTCRLMHLCSYAVIYLSSYSPNYLGSNALLSDCRCHSQPLRQNPVAPSVNVWDSSNKGNMQIKQSALLYKCTVENSWLIVWTRMQTRTQPSFSRLTTQYSLAVDWDLWVAPETDSWLSFMCPAALMLWNSFHGPARSHFYIVELDGTFFGLKDTISVNMFACTF